MAKESLNNKTAAVNESLSSGWRERIQPVIDNVKYRSSILTTMLIVVAILFIIHFLIQCYNSHIRSVRHSERKKLSERQGAVVEQRSL